jgi:hypothetical protein
LFFEGEDAHNAAPSAGGRTISGEPAVFAACRLTQPELRRHSSPVDYFQALSTNLKILSTK